MDTPVIRPVNYVFDERSQSVAFRTADGSKFHAMLVHGNAAFEIDGIDPGSRTGWSVIIVGMTEEVTTPASSDASTGWASRLGRPDTRRTGCGSAHGPCPAAGSCCPPVLGPLGLSLSDDWARGMSLGTLALIGICGLCGPLLSASAKAHGTTGASLLIAGFRAGLWSRRREAQSGSRTRCSASGAVIRRRVDDPAWPFAASGRQR